MAMTQGALWFMGGLATLSTVGIFAQYSDEETRLLIGFFASFAWAMFAFGAWDVEIYSSFAATRSEAILPLVLMGLGLSLIMFVFTLYQFFVAMRQGIGQAEYGPAD